MYMYAASTGTQCREWMTARAGRRVCVRGRCARAASRMGGAGNDVRTRRVTGMRLPGRVRVAKVARGARAAGHVCGERWRAVRGVRCMRCQNGASWMWRRADEVPGCERARPPSSGGRSERRRRTRIDEDAARGLRRAGADVGDASARGNAPTLVCIVGAVTFAVVVCTGEGFPSCAADCVTAERRGAVERHGDSRLSCATSVCGVTGGGEGGGGAWSVESMGMARTSVFLRRGRCADTAEAANALRCGPRGAREHQAVTLHLCEGYPELFVWMWAGNA
ncbi:hypothetical protein DFH06DRAFT_1122107 [Mycena polygramma]|nr:hypothetical protein DFH06DRAFT_1122107 [Mycena polygramma]